MIFVFFAIPRVLYTVSIQSVFFKFEITYAHGIVASLLKQNLLLFQINKIFERFKNKKNSEHPIFTYPWCHARHICCET